MIKVSMLMAAVLLVAETLPAQSARTLAGATIYPRDQASPVSSAKVSVAFNNTPLAAALDTLEKRSGVEIMFVDQALPNRRVSYTATNASVYDVLSAILRNTGMRHDYVRPGVIKIVAVSPAARRGVQGTVSGTVVDAATKKPLAGARVTLDNSASGVATLDDGSFAIANVSDGSHTLTVRLLGYSKATKQFSFQARQTESLVISLQPSANVLDQVVVTGTVVATEQRAIPNSITVVTSKDIENRGITNIEQLFRGEVPGVIALTTGPSWGTTDMGSAQIFVRGSTSPHGGYGDPFKTYIDGVEVAQYQHINALDPRMIERIEILPGPQASTIYGSGALNGVMQIFLKKGIASNKPRLTTLLSYGIIENSINSKLTPMHDDGLRIDGGTGKLTYSTGASYQYTGAWAPGYSEQITSLDLGLKRSSNPLNIDITGRLSNRKFTPTFGLSNTPYFWNAIATGRYRYDFTTNTGARLTRVNTNIDVKQQTLGLTTEFTKLQWWQHRVTVGRDENNRENILPEPQYILRTDSLRSFQSYKYSRNTLAYNNTIRGNSGPVSLTLTTGADGWRTTSLTTLASTTPSLTGSLAGTVLLTRLIDRSTGYYAQSQIGFYEFVFLTAGLRAEKSPNFGKNRGAYYSPRFGVSLVHELGGMTIKARSAYGKSTRMPWPGAKETRTVGTSTQLGNPDLGPEYQDGGEIGLDFYLGRRVSLQLTGYKQEVKDAIVTITHSLNLDTFEQSYMYENVGEVWNDGIEAKAMVNFGPLSVDGAYTRQNSVVKRINPRAQVFDDIFQTLGSQLSGIPYSTNALTLRYAGAKTSSMLTTSYFGQTIGVDFKRFTDERFDRFFPRIGNRPDMALPGYVTMNWNASRYFSPRYEGFVRIDNLTHQTNSDLNPIGFTRGRTTVIGMRLRTR